MRPRCSAALFLTEVDQETFGVLVFKALLLNEKWVMTSTMFCIPLATVLIFAFPHRSTFSNNKNKYRWLFWFNLALMAFPTFEI